MEILLVLLLALLIDRLLGEPPLKLHPTVWMGKAIAFLSTIKKEKHGRDTLHGVAMLGVPLLFSGIGYFLLEILPFWLFIPIGAFLLKSTITWRSLRDYTLLVKNSLENNDLQGAKGWLPYIVGRGIEDMNEEQVVSATVESIGESSSDGTISPLFYFWILSFISFPLGVAGSLFYRAVNTLDSMIGYKRYGGFGLPSAKLDDLLNFLPARISTFMIVISAFILRNDWRNAIYIYRRDRKNTPSPNAGNPMSAIAGALRVRLEKGGSYSLGDKKEELKGKHIIEALRIVDLSITLFLMIIFTSYLVNTAVVK